MNDGVDPVARQYAALPYPERDPADEARRLVEGSPSHPAEIDHFLFRGLRDWSRPFRALVAGCGTGDGLVMLAQKLADAGCPAEITALDLSDASLDVARARLAARGLSADLRRADLAEAPEIAAREGAFDYIDCCGVLHHLERPEDGAAALSAAMAPEGGLGFMVYAPHGRHGVYPLQAAFEALLGDEAPMAKVALARRALKALPESNGFRGNPWLTDHEASDAGLHDLLLHARDRPYEVEALDALLAGAGLRLVSFVEPVRYDPARLLPEGETWRERLARLSPAARMGLAERLAGDLRMHVGYAAPAARGATVAKMDTAAVPRLRGVDPRALGRSVAESGRIRARFQDRAFDFAVPKAAGPLIARLGAGRPLGALAAEAGMDWFAFAAAFGPAWRALTEAGMLRASRGIAT